MKPVSVLLTFVLFLAGCTENTPEGEGKPFDELLGCNVVIPPENVTASCTDESEPWPEHGPVGATFVERCRMEIAKPGMEVAFLADLLSDDQALWISTPRDALPRTWGIVHDTSPPTFQKVVQTEPEMLLDVPASDGRIYFWVHATWLTTDYPPFRNATVRTEWAFYGGEKPLGVHHIQAAGKDYYLGGYGTVNGNPFTTDIAHRSGGYSVQIDYWTNGGGDVPANFEHFSC